MIRVLLADDQLVIRAGLRVLLEGEGDIIVTGEASDGEQAVSLARDTLPDVALMDIRMPGLDGVEATRVIAGDPRLSGVKVLILTTLESDGYVFEALRAGASGFLVKDGDVAEVLRAVRVVAAGEALLSPGATRRLVEELTAWPERGRLAPALLVELTDREREVMALVAYGLTNREIAERLVISPATAKTHVSRTMLKLHAHDRAQLVVLAYQTGLVVYGGWAESAAADRIAGRVRA
ncbi:MAG TPA: response regulator transcription factor [Solirubrobacteraceae bacterium]|nr:response regulator transcription factor [Solirubrobacteraceae bacterium]